MATLEQTVEATVDLLQQFFSNSAAPEPMRRAMAAILHDDHQRRNLRDGRHPIVGETWQEFREFAARQRDSRHPTTGETYEEARSKYGVEDGDEV